MKRTVSLFLVLFGFWFIMSGHTEGWLLALGVASTALTVWLARRLDAIDHEGHPLHLAWRGMPYWGWLMVEIVKANIDVARAILAGPSAIAPGVFTFKAGQKDDLGRTIHANSITLTPGTVTMGVKADGTLTIHALTRASREGVESGEMDRRVSRLMGEA